MMEDEVVEYGMAAAELHDQLSGYVNEQISLGWQPYGFPFLAPYGEQTLIHQPMVRILKKKKNLK